MPLVFMARGESVLSEMQNYLKSQWISSDEMRHNQFIKLKDIIAHAYSNVSYYKRRFDHVGIHPNDIKCCEDIKYLPYITKEDLSQLPRQNFLAYPIGRKYTVRRTSGTSGKPTVIYADRVCSAKTLATRYMCTSWYGVEMGDKQCRFWGSALRKKDKLKEKIKDTILNRVRISSPMTSNQDMDNFISTLLRFKPSYFYGYPSLLEKFADHINRFDRRLCIDIRLIISTAEKLHRYQREKIEDCFGTKVVDEYGCSEVDIIAFECPYGSMHIMSENLFVEVINEENNQSKSGEIVITDLNNKLMPLIRYKLGDLGKLGKNECSCGRKLPVLKSIEGRTSKIQFIRTPDGRDIHSVFFAYLFEDIADCGIKISHFRIIQENKNDIRVLVVIKDQCDKMRNKLFSILKQNFISVFGNEMRLIIEYVKEIPVNDINGKMGYFESNLK